MLCFFGFKLQSFAVEPWATISIEASFVALLLERKKPEVHCTVMKEEVRLRETQHALLLGEGLNEKHGGKHVLINNIWGLSLRRPWVSHRMKISYMQTAHHETGAYAGQRLLQDTECFPHSCSSVSVIFTLQCFSNDKPTSWQASWRGPKSIVLRRERPVCPQGSKVNKHLWVAVYFLDEQAEVSKTPLIKCADRDCSYQL